MNCLKKNKVLISDENIVILKEDRIGRKLSSAFAHAKQLIVHTSTIYNIVFGFHFVCEHAYCASMQFFCLLACTLVGFPKSTSLHVSKTDSSL